MTQQYEIDAAFYQGLREGFDPEVAEDLGIPMDSETVERQQRAAREVTGLIEAANRPKAVDGDEEHRELDRVYGRVTCANCNRPGCPGCGRS